MRTCRQHNCQLDAKHKGWHKMTNFGVTIEWLDGKWRQGETSGTYPKGVK